MAEIDIKLIKTLRETTGSGMMDCKKALVASEGDLEKAILWLREKGISGSDKKSGRITAEGTVVAFVAEDKKAGVLLEINIETDFASKNEAFQAFASDLAQHILVKRPKSLSEGEDALLEQKFLKDEAQTVELARKELVARIGENISIRRFEVFEGEYISSYIHGGGRVGVLVDFKVVDSSSDLEEVAKDIAMQVAAMNPSWVDREQVDSKIYEQEKELARTQALNEGKPEKIVEMIVKGRLEKFYEARCLVDQGFVKDDSKKIADVLKEAQLEVSRFVRYEMGEGIEKKQEDFASEVMKQIKV